MPSITLTRPELYELVWSKPRSQLAKDLQISDVAIGKHCARAHIPVPPRGYWAKQEAGKPTLRLPLTIRLPGHSPQVHMGVSAYERGWGYPVDPDAQLTQPAFEEDLQQQVDAALKIVGRVTSSRDLANPSPALRRLLSAEADRREKHAHSDWSSDKPRFDGVVHQRQLRIFDAIAKALEPVTEAVSVFDQDQWVQGHGTLHLLRCHVRFGGTYFELLFAEPADPKALRRDTPIKEVRSTTLWFGRESSGLGVSSWTDVPGRKLERQLGEVVAAVLRHAELGLRVHAEAAHEQRLKWREQARKERAEAARKQELKRLEAVAANRRRVRQGIVGLARRRRDAGDIRDLVEALSRHPDLAASDPGPFSQWCAQALQLADELDPMKRPLADVLQDLGERGNSQEA